MQTMKDENTLENEMKLEIMSKSSNEAFARISVAAFASQLDPTIEEIADIKTAVSEAVTNSIIHAYPDKTGPVKIRAILYEDEVKIEVSDNGEGIENIDEAKEFAKDNLDKGVKMAKSVTDKFKNETPKRAKKAVKNAENLPTKTVKKAKKSVKKTSPKLKKDGTPKAKPGPKPKQPQTEPQA